MGRSAGSHPSGTPGGGTCWQPTMVVEGRGAVVAVGAATFLVLAVVAGAGPVTRTNVGFWPLLGGGVVAVGLAAAAGAGLYLGVVRPFFRRRSTVGWVAAVVAVAFAIEGVLAASFP